MTETVQDILAYMKEQGGVVSPTTIELPDGGELVLHGMTLRDWFAGQALAAIVSSADQRVAMQNVHAKSAYAYADAMLTERSKTEPSHD